MDTNQTGITLSKLKWINWIGFVMFAFGFVLAEKFFSIEQVDDYAQYFMVGGSLIAFLFGSSIAWLGFAICAFCFAWAPPQEWIKIETGSVTIDPLWIWLTGYLLSFFSERD